LTTLRVGYQVGMLIFENVNSRYENFNSWDSTSSRIPDAKQVAYLRWEQTGTATLKTNWPHTCSGSAGGVQWGGGRQPT